MIRADVLRAKMERPTACLDLLGPFMMAQIQALDFALARSLSLPTCQDPKRQANLHRRRGSHVLAEDGPSRARRPECVLEGWTHF
jgi:hypothetical protein